MTIGEFLAFAREEPRIVGVVLTGSRGRGALTHPESDWDLRVLVVDGEEAFAESLNTPHGSELEIAAATVTAFRRSPEWDRYSYAHVEVPIDKLGGDVRRLVDAQGQLSPGEARERARTSLDAYLNSLYRSLGNSRLGLDLESRLDACEAVSFLLGAVFAVEGRVRPFNKYLAWELENYPLAEWSGPELLAAVERAFDGDVRDQQALFREVERRARSLGFGDVLDGWGADVRAFRGE